MRRILGVLIAAIALVGGALGSRSVDRSRDRSIRRETDQAALAGAQRAADGLAAVGTDLRLKVDNAADNPRLIFALQGNVDDRTMRDLWRTEEWWRPWRTEFKVYAVAVGGARLDILEGIDAGQLDCASLLRRVRDRGEASADVLVGRGWPYAAAATIVRVPGRQTPPLLLLAKPVDQPMLLRLAEKSGGAVVLTDGRASLLEAGPPGERARLGQAIGAERDGPVFHAADGTWSGAATPVASGLWLWTFASASAAAHDARAAASERKVILWIGAALAAAAALVIGLRRAAPGPAATASIPAATGSSSARTSAGGVDPGAATALASAMATEPPGAPPPAPPATAAAAFGRYTLLDRLGEGGMAEVYTAVTFGAEGFRRKFVIKRLRAELAREPAAVDQFIDEANLASSMVHSNIVPVFDFGKVGDEYFMAQEYILGRDLARVTRRHLERHGRPLPAEVVLYAAHETLKALEYAHTKTDEHGQPQGIVHRDVSPTNVIVSARGEVKLFDFGIVKAEGRVTRTESGVVKGNVSFMSPEQARGVGVDARADLFSLGLLLYYCLTGQVLYTGGTTYELLVKAATGPSPVDFNRLSALPPPCDDLLRRALQVNPNDRFPTAHAFDEAVLAHVGGGAIQLSRLMDSLFSEDFRHEETRFRTFGPPAGGGSAVSPSTTRQTDPRRT